MRPFDQNQSQIFRMSEGQNFIVVEGVKLEIKYYPGTKPDTPTLVFLHEGLGCVKMWRNFPEKLSEITGYPAFLFSRQGYGNSDPCEIPRPLNYMQIEGQVVLPAILDVAGISKHVLIGHSDGASIALINAGYKQAKDLQAVISMAPHIFCEQLSITSIEKARETYINDKKYRKKLTKFHNDNIECAFWGWNNAWLDSDFKNWNIEKFLKHICVPQLVLQGKDDPYGTMAQVNGIVEQSGDTVAVSILPDCGHAPYKEKMLESLTIITEFLTQF